MTETITDAPVLTALGVLQTIREYDYDNSKINVIRLFNNQEVSRETFYLD